MIFSEQELICINSVLDGRTIFGTRFSIPEDFGLKYYDDTLQQLKNHGMLSGNGKINEQFALAVNTLKEYKNADTYLNLNGGIFAINQVLNHVIFLAKVDWGYELTAFDKGMFLYEFIRSNSFLANEDTEDKRIRKPLDLLKWQQSMETTKPEDLIYVYKIQNNECCDVLFLYHCGTKGFIYDVVVEELTQCSSLAIRKMLFRLFDFSIVEGGAVNGGLA